MTNWYHATLTVNSLVANCHILVLEEGDLITFQIEDDEPFTINITENYTNIQNTDEFVGILTVYLANTEINVIPRNNNCLEFKCNRPFSINELT
jgi:hypothetical protein